MSTPCWTLCRGWFRVPPVLGFEDGCLRMRFMSGVHGQELLESGHGVGVLRACGTMLRLIHQLDAREITAALPSRARGGQVLAHGDYGPQNVLLDPATLEITGILDWEWAHAGDPVEDLAWCEWIVRMHHPGLVSLLGVFFNAYAGQYRRGPTVRRLCSAGAGLCLTSAASRSQEDPAKRNGHTASPWPEHGRNDRRWCGSWAGPWRRVGSHRGSSQTSYRPGSSRCCRSSRGGLIIPGGRGWMTGRSCRILFVLNTRPGAYRWIVEATACRRDRFSSNRPASQSASVIGNPSAVVRHSNDESQ
jgi:Phosphotransferase enzyme family